MIRRSTLILAATLLAACAAPGGSPEAAWSREAPLLTPRAAHAVVATERAIYALAGTGPDGRPVMEVERYDGERWQRETTLPAQGLNAPAAAAIGDAIYLIGGFGTTTNRPTDAVHRYDPRTKSWSAAAPLPAPRGGHAAAVLDGRIHVVGGGNERSTLADHSVYDPRSNRWSDRAPLPRSLGSPALVVHEGKLVSIGGRSGPNDFPDVHVYDAANDRWTPGVPIPARGTGGALVLAGAIYYFGGESQLRKAVLAEVLRLDAASGRWVAAPAMPTGRSFARAVPFRGRAFIVGGSTTYGSSHASPGAAVVESLRP